MFSKKEGVIMKRWSFVLAVILIISFCFTGCQNQQMFSVEEYNAKYAKTIDFEKGIDNKTFGNADYRVFLAGEYHAQTKGYQSKKMLIQYLHEKQDVDYLICEVGMGHGMFLDDYIQNGDDEKLKFFMNQIENTMAWTKEEYEFWQWLYEYNQQQSEQDKLHIIGLDVEIERYPKCTIKGLSLLLDDSVTPAEEIQPLIERMKQGDETVIWEFPKVLEKYPEQMQEAFGENFPWAEQYAKNVEATKKYFELDKSKGVNAHQIRDNAMADNLCFVLEQLPEDAKFFGQFGGAHVIQSAIDTGNGFDESYDRFAMQLQEDDSPVKGEVCSIYMVFLQKNEDSRWGYSYMEYQSEMPIYLFRNYYAQDTFIPLNEKGSPFTRYGEEQVQDREGSDNKAAMGLTDYFQKILLLPDSEACEPYQKS